MDTRLSDLEQLVYEIKTFRPDCTVAIDYLNKVIDKLKYEVKLTDALLESLNNKDRYIIEAFYIENIRMHKIAVKLNYYETKSVWNNKDRIMNSLVELV